MSERVKSIERITKEQEKRMLKAQKSFSKMQEEIAPFIRRRRFKRYSTAGEWCETASLCL